MRLFSFSLMSLLCLSLTLSAKEYQVTGPQGECWVVHLSEQADCAALKKHLSSTVGISEEKQVLLADGHKLEDGILLKALNGKPIKVITKNEIPEGGRDYWQELSYDEMRIIREQVVAIANSSLPRLLCIQSQLESMEKEIDHVHPLRYLLYVFEEEETKVAMRNVNRRGGFVWSKLNDRISYSLRKDHELGNVTTEQVDDVAFRLGIAPDTLYDPANRCDSATLISELIRLVPRGGDFDRYNM